FAQRFHLFQVFTDSQIIDVLGYPKHLIAPDLSGLLLFQPLTYLGLVKLPLAKQVVHVFNYPEKCFFRKKIIYHSIWVAQQAIANAVKGLRMHCSLFGSWHFPAKQMRRSFCKTKTDGKYPSVFNNHILCAEFREPKLFPLLYTNPSHQCSKRRRPIYRLALL